MIKSSTLFLCGLFLIGCQASSSAPPTSPPPPPGPAPSAAQQTYSNYNAGLSFSYPADWKQAGETSTQMKWTAAGDSQFTLDVPTLPFHIPGMIPIDQVESGYVNDVKKRMPDLVETTLPDPTLPSATQRRVKLSGHLNGKPSIDEAALIVHNDKVYILAIDSDEQGYPPMHAAMDGILSSLRWTK